jgi:hypothetical protein
MNDPIFRDFLERQFREAMALVASSDILRLMPAPASPPQQYLAEFKCKGLIQNNAGEIVEHNLFGVAITFPEEYLRRVDVGMMLTYLGPEPIVWHPNISGPFVCLHGIRPGTPLVTILYACFELFTWNLKNTSDEGLNRAASQWARHQDPARFPIDRRPLKRRTLHLQTEEAAR